MMRKTNGVIKIILGGLHNMDTDKSTTYILIHGAWHGAWCWDKVVPLLEEQGHTAIAVDLPGHGNDTAPIHEQNLTTYARKVEKVVREQNGNLVLVGHSLGGMVITQTAEYCGDLIKKLIYVAAFLPQNGQSADGRTALRPTDWAEMAGFGLVYLSEDGLTSTMTKKFAFDGLFNDLPEETANEAFGKLTSEAVASQYQNVEIGDRFARVPRIYVRCARDHSIPLDLQDKMLEASPCERVYTLETGHSPFLADPGGLAEILLRERYSQHST